MADFQDFEIRIGKGPNGYRARTSSSHFAPHDFTAPFQEGELDRLLARTGVFRDLGMVEDLPVDGIREIGARLFGVVFGGAVRRDWDAFQGEVLRSGGAIRLCLLLEDAELWEWPWEYLCDPDNDYLALSPKVSIVRCPVPLRPSPPRKAEARLRVLVVSAHPKGTPRLSFEHEWKDLTVNLEGMEEGGWIDLKQIEHATLSLLRRELKKSWDVLHFIGHGTFGRLRSEGVLLFEKDNGERDEVSGRGLARVLRKQEQPPRLVVLNACEGGRAGQVDPFAGVAQGLAREGTAAVVAMQFKVSDRAALVFSRAFYEALSEGGSVDRAVYEGRHALLSECSEAEWGNPVLYMRSPVEQLVDSARPAIIDPPPLPEKKLPWRRAVGLALFGALSASTYWASTLPDTHPDCPSPPGLDIPFVKIPAGAALRIEKGPLMIEEPYCMAKFEVTQEEWWQVMGKLPKQGTKGDRLPVANISKGDAKIFLDALNRIDHGGRYRFPSEIQWEYAARAGTSGKYSFEGGEDDLHLYGNCWSGKPVDGYDGVAEVGSFKPNRWGLHDMYGNVAEWVDDVLPAPVPGVDLYETRVIRRGGSFNNSPKNCNSVFSSDKKMEHKDQETGFRVVRDPVRPRDDRGGDLPRP